MISSEKNIRIQQELDDLVAIASESELSSINKSVSAIISLAMDDDSSVRDLVELIEYDAPLTAQILRRVNSAAYSPRSNIYSINQAVIWLGLDRLKSLALSQKVCSIFSSAKVIHGYSRSQLWDHSLATAVLSKMIWRMEFGVQGNDAYAAGLLHDIGIVVLDQFMHKEFRTMLSVAERDNCNLNVAGSNQWGYSHYDIGSKLLSSWELPTDLCVAIGGMANPFEVADEYFRLTAVLFIAKNICHQKGYGYGCGHTFDSSLFNSCCEALGIMPQSLDMIFKKFTVEFTKLQMGNK